MVTVKMDKNNLKISVIMPVYNVEKYLEQCINSIICYGGNIEVILVDDGSTDECPVMCEEWAQKDSRIKVVHKQNGGLSDARNAGLERSTGDYIMFVDSDDFVDETICDVLLNDLKNNDADFSMCGVEICNDYSANSKNKKNKVVIFKEQEVIKSLLLGKINYLVIACGKLYKRKLFEKLNFKVGKFHEDEFFIHHILGETNCFTYNSNPLYKYYCNSQSITNNIKEKNILDAQEAFDERYVYLSNKVPKLQKLIDQHYLSNLRALVLSSLKFKALNKKLEDKFKCFYKKSLKKGFKNWLFYHFKKVYCVLLRFKGKVIKVDS